ncbi:MAG: hypothetical protein ACXVLZ_07645 [Acidimicrobiia bacterium]
MSVERFDLEARLRVDLSRLADALLDDATDAAEPRSPASTEVVRPRGRRRRGRALAAAGVAAALVAGALLVATNLAESRRHASSPFAGGLGRPVALPTPSLSPRSTPVMVWTGRSLLVWGGYQGDPVGPLALRDGASLTDGGSWEPTTENQWGHPGSVGAWAGDRLVVLAKNGGAEYDAFGTKTWTDLPRLPDERGGGFRAVAALDGRVYALVSSIAGSGDAVGIAQLDDTNGTWRMRATTSRGAEASTFSLVPGHGGLDLWADGVRRAHYDPERDAWRSGDGLRVPGGFVTPRVVTVGTSVAVVDAGGSQGPAVLDPATGRWTSLTGGDRTVGAGSTAASTGDRFVVWGGQQNPGVWAWTLPTG